MAYNYKEEKELLDLENKLLLETLKEEGKTSLYLTALGNSISDGFSLTEPDDLLLKRNDTLQTAGKERGLEVKTYQLSRSENNNGLIVADWIRRDLSERDCYEWNRMDYLRAIKEGSPLLTEDQINEMFKNPSDEKITEVIFKKSPDLANIVILNLGTGSFLDILTRHGKLTWKNVMDNLERDRSGIASILEMIQSHNREAKTKTQVYLCGAPRIGFLPVTDVSMNSGIKRIGKEFANVVYVPSFKRQTIYRKDNGKLGVDIHYNRAEYLHLLGLIEEQIIINYAFKDALTEIDSKLFEMSDENDTRNGCYNIDDVLDIVDEFAKASDESKTGCDYNTFVKKVAAYIARRYPYDFYRLHEAENIGKVLTKKLTK